VHYRAGLQSVHGFRCCDSIAPNVKCHRVPALALCLVESIVYVWKYMCVHACHFTTSVFVIWSKTDIFGRQSCLCRYIKNISANFQEWMANSLKTDAKVGCYELS